jgi:hypothetical protein
MGGLRNGPLRRWRAEWAPTAWDLGAPVCIHDVPEFADERLRGWLKNDTHDLLDKEVLLYPQGVIQDGAYRYYVLPRTLRSHVWSVWAEDNPFSGRFPCHYRYEIRLVDAGAFDAAWHQSGTVGSPPQPSGSSVGWLVTRDGKMFSTDESPQSDTPQDPILELPKTMTSFLFEVYTKGVRRFHKQATLGACLVPISFVLLTLLPDLDVDWFWPVYGVPWILGLYQWFAARGGIRQAQLADAVSRGTYREPRLVNSDPHFMPPPGRLAPWFVWSIVKRTAAALILLGVAVSVSQASSWFALCLAWVAILVGVDAVAFKLATDTEGRPFKIGYWR